MNWIRRNDTGVIAALVFAAFAPLLWTRFAFHNELGFWVGPPGSPFYESGHLILIGRPLLAILASLQKAVLQPFDSLLALQIVRVLSMTLLVLLASLLNRFLAVESNLTRVERIGLITISLLQPSWLAAVMSSGNMLPGVFSYLFGLLGSMVFMRALESGSMPRKLNRGAAAFVLLGIAFYSYPPGALAFFWLPLVQEIFGKQRPSRRRFAGTALFFGIACAILLAVDSLLIEPTLCRIISCWTWADPTSNEYSRAVSFDLAAKAAVIVDSLQLVSMSWANLAIDSSLHPASYVAVAAMIVAMLLLCGTRRRREGPASGFDWELPIRVAILAVFLNLANLATGFAIIAFRTVAPSTILLGTLFVLLLERVGRKVWRPYLTFSAIAVLVGCAFATTSHFSGYYRTATENLLAAPKFAETCKAETKDFRWVYSDPNLLQFFGPRQGRGNYSDLGLEVLIPWALPGACRLSPQAAGR